MRKNNLTESVDPQFIQQKVDNGNKNVTYQITPHLPTIQIFDHENQKVSSFHYELNVCLVCSKCILVFFAVSI